MNEVRTFVESGLRDLSVSRSSFKWGVEVPGDPRHVIYVWIDALTNYYSALQDSPRKAAFWGTHDAPLAIHLVGKEIVRFHAVYWPAMLMAAGLPLPRKILAHGWWTVDGEKMSKTLGNVVDPRALAADLSASALRYFVMREIPLGKMATFRMMRCSSATTASWRTTSATCSIARWRWSKNTATEQLDAGPNRQAPRYKVSGCDHGPKRSARKSKRRWRIFSRKSARGDLLAGSGRQHVSGTKRRLPR